MSAEELLREIRAELRSRGLERRPTGRVLAELGVHTALLVAGLAVFFAAESGAFYAGGVTTEQISAGMAWWLDATQAVPPAPHGSDAAVAMH